MIAGYAAAVRQVAALEREWNVLWQRSQPAPETAAVEIEDDREADDARSSLSAFASRMHRNYQTAAHIRRLVTELEWAATTPGARLIVTFPPRHSKSLHVSEHLPAWFLGNHPDARVIGASHTQRLANRFSRRVRNKIAHPFFPFPGIRISDDSGAVEAWDLAGTYGGYFAVGVGGSPAGTGADLIVIDDPIKSAAKAESDVFREALWDWYREDIRTRLEPGGSIVLTATRFHEDDLTGRLLAEQEGEGEPWRHLHLPAIDDGGNALWPERWPLDTLLKIKGAVGSRTWNAQYQGAPTPDEGGILKRWWWRFWHQPGAPLPPVPVKTADGTIVFCPCEALPSWFDDHCQSWDMAFKATADSSYVVGQVWSVMGANAYLRTQVREHLDFPQSVAAVRSMSGAWPFVAAKLIEDKANGPAVISSLKNEVTGIIAVEPDGSKEARAHAVSPAIEAGNVYLPHPSIAPWVNVLIDEAASFPFGTTDQVDALTQGLMRVLYRGRASVTQGSYFPADQPAEDEDDWGGRR